MCDSCKPGYMWAWNKKCETCAPPQKKKLIDKALCDICYQMKPKNKWYDEEFFMCNKCVACEHCNTIDDKIKQELDMNEISTCCAKCNS